MHIIRMDIDRKNSAEHLQVGPLGCGLNAIFSTTATASSAMTRFVKGLLFRGNGSNELSYDEKWDAIDGSLQWADASGHVRLMSYAGGSPLLPSQFVHSPLHPSERIMHADDRDPIRGLGNIFWEGHDQVGRWDELRGDILGMVFCSPLGTLSPQKLWWAASRLGIHSASKREMDEGYQQLKAEEQELLERLRNSESVDHDRAWWSIERDRIAAELAYIQNKNQLSLEKAERCCQPCSPPGTDRLSTILAEIERLRSLQHESRVNDANIQFNEHKTDGLRVESGSSLFNNVSLHNAAFGRTKSVSQREEFVLERQRMQTKIDQLLAEQAALESEARHHGPASSSHSVKPWDETHLRQQHSHSEEMLRRWDRRAQTHRRLAEVQSHLKTRSPYRRTTEGSLIPDAEKYLRELTSGAARRLPSWAIEASYLDQNSNIPSESGSRIDSGYREGYYVNTLPSENTRLRKLVDLAIRLAIAHAALPRIGLIPMLLDGSVGGFRGESLEQILHVLSTFSRDGRQLLLSTDDEYVARRIAAHGGTVSRMIEVMRYASPSYVMEGQQELGMHPYLDLSPANSTFRDSRALRIANSDSPEIEIREVNRQLTGLANEQATGSWWLSQGSKVSSHPHQVDSPYAQASASRKFFLYPDSSVQDVPGVTPEWSRRLNSVGVYRVSDLLRAPSSKLASMIRVDSGMLEQTQRVAELMCGTPQLRAFDAQVLVGCGITRSDALRSLPASELVRRVETFLSAPSGQDLLRSATSYEFARIRNWITDMRNSSSRRPREAVVSIRPERARNRDRARRMRRETNHDAGPRIVRTSEVQAETGRTTHFAASDIGTAQNTGLSDSPKSDGRRVRQPRSSVARSTSASAGSQWKFYLDIDSPVVDAPSIGPRMAERMAPLNIRTVGDLIAVDPVNVAARLEERGVTAEVVQQWQRQALLVCRIPNLRGHDAQLIVGCGLISAEQLAASDSFKLFGQVVGFASSRQGVRLLRGSNAPDQEEVSNWIQWAQNCRAVRAA